MELVIDIDIVGESGALMSGLVYFKMNRWAVLVYSQSTRLNADQGKAVDTDKYRFSHWNNHRIRISQAVSIHHCRGASVSPTRTLPPMNLLKLYRVTKMSWNNTTKHFRIKNKRASC